MTTAPLTAPLVARTVPISDPGPLLGLLPRTDVVSWVRHGEGLVGWGEAARLVTGGPRRFTDAETAVRSLLDQAVVRDQVSLPGTGPVAFGSFAFSASSPAGASLVVPEVVVGHRGDRWWLTTVDNGTSGRRPPLVTAGRRPAVGQHDIPPGPGWVTCRPGARPVQEWTRIVADAVARIDAGQLEKAVLARDLRVRTQNPVDPRWLLRRLAERYPECWTFRVDDLVGATPELLVRREDDRVTSRVLAGTICRTGDADRDPDLADCLTRSGKDRSEHDFAVRSVVQALAPHCSSTEVAATPYVLHLANVLHLATDVAGVLADGTSALGLAAALHPSAAVCGTPTDVAAALIEEIEGMDRGRYAGPVGWMDATGNGEWGIALRCARVDARDPRRLRLFAGCGIVRGSDPDAELAESTAKLSAIQDLLGQG